MTDTLGISEFRDACQLAECPFCVLRARSEVRYLRFFLGENVNDGGVNKQLWDSYGFCRRHALLLLKQSDGFGLAIVYERVLQVWEEALDHIARENTGAGLADPGHIAQHLFHPQATAGHLAADEMEPKGRCVACLSTDESERFIISEIAELLDQDAKSDVWVWLGKSSGLCLAHLRSLLAEMRESAAVSLVCKVQAEHIAALRRDLNEFVRKHDYRYHDETYTDAERKSWRDAIALLVSAS